MLVGAFNPSEEYLSVGMMKFPIYGKIKLMFQTTNQTVCLCTFRDMAFINADLHVDLFSDARQAMTSHQWIGFVGKIYWRLTLQLCEIWQNIPIGLVDRHRCLEFSPHFRWLNLYLASKKHPACVKKPYRDISVHAPYLDI